MNAPLFSSSPAFHQAFETGLSELLQKGALGPFILVCANATFDHRLHWTMATRLGEQYERLRRDFVRMKLSLGPRKLRWKIEKIFDRKPP